MTIFLTPDDCISALSDETDEASELAVITMKSSLFHATHHQRRNGKGKETLLDKLVPVMLILQVAIGFFIMAYVRQGGRSMKSLRLDQKSLEWQDHRGGVEVVLAPLIPSCSRALCPVMDALAWLRGS